jgi:adenylate kinase
MLGTKLLIVFGVSGVGKTTACAEYACRSEHVEHLSASQLLCLERSSATERSEDEALLDQHRLVELVLHARAATEADVLLLDAHSVVLVGGRQLIVPVDIIASMEPTGLIFYEADPEVVLHRRLDRGDQITDVPDLDGMKQLQFVALRAVEEYSRILRCPISIVKADQSINLAVAIENLL